MHLKNLETLESFSLVQNQYQSSRNNRQGILNIKNRLQLNIIQESCLKLKRIRFTEGPIMDFKRL